MKILEIRNFALENLPDRASKRLKRIEYDSNNLNGITQIEVSENLVTPRVSEFNWYDLIAAPTPISGTAYSKEALSFEGVLGVYGEDGIIESIR